MIILLIKTHKNNKYSLVYKTTTFSTEKHLVKLTYLNKITLNAANGKKNIEVLWSNIKEMPLSKNIS
jgi:hypothetical protein